MLVYEVKTYKKRFLPLLLLADEQEDMIDRYLERGIMYVLEDDGPKAECVVTDEGDGVLEIKNLAVLPEAQGRGYGKALVKWVEERFRCCFRILQVGTGDSPRTIPFYEKCGFVRSHVIENFFTDHYDHPIWEDGVLLKDMVVLRRRLDGSVAAKKDGQKIIELRHILPGDDRMAVSRIYEEAWKTAYRGIVPQAYLDSIPGGRWAERIDRPGWEVLLALSDGIPVGTVTYGASRLQDRPDWGEIYAIYLLPAWWRQGIGRALLQNASDELRETGMVKQHLWVLEENLPARRFYEKMGFCFSGGRTSFTLGGKELWELCFEKA